MAEREEHRLTYGKGALPDSSWPGWQEAAQIMGLAGENAPNRVREAVQRYHQQQPAPDLEPLQERQQQVDKVKPESAMQMRYLHEDDLAETG